MKGNLMYEMLGKRLLLELEKNHITQRELAEIVGLNETTVSRYISGEREPKYEILANIATALQTTVSYLLGEEDENDFYRVKTILARNAGKLSQEEKRELIDIIEEN
jgi:transcriptional regulator with XRE-family HTH domain